MRDFLLSKGRIVDFENIVTLVTLADDTQVVFKPVPSDDLGDAHAEVAAFKASKFLGFPEVPPTVIRKINGKTGSLQLYVEPTQDILKPGAYEKVLQNAAPDDLANLKLFYFVFGQWDSGPQNLIVTKKSDRIHLVAIDNSGIRNRQYVQYSHLPFVRVCYSELLNTNDWHLPFPYQNVKMIENPTFEKLYEILGDKFPKKTLMNLSKHTKKSTDFHRYVIYKNSLWIQFHASDISFVLSHTDHYPQKTIAMLKRLNKRVLDNIFSEAKGSDFLTNDYLEAILNRRDQVVKAYENARKNISAKKVH
ncbi:MAG TPA: hypothetical protein VNK03_00940 [Gammaproteobacteria bacterium]|nr:hypothetical protein [Gammaproteobacteria bacterium]